jgi:hypothetical protein
MVDDGQGLDTALEHFALKEDRLTNPSSISWVLDLSRPILPSEPGRHFRCDTSMVHSLEFFLSAVSRLSRDGRVLLVPGWNLGTCRIVLRFDDDVAGVARQVSELIDLFHDPARLAQDPTWRATGWARAPAVSGDNILQTSPGEPPRRFVQLFCLLTRS